MENRQRLVRRSAFGLVIQLSLEKSTDFWADNVTKRIANRRAIRNCINFKVSNGWLKKLRQRYSIVYRKLNGEAADCPLADADPWKETLTQMIAKYDPKDVFN